MPVLTKRKKRKAPFQTVADLLDKLGNIPPSRVCMNPPPGTATKRDLLHWHHATGRRFELVTRTVVENTMGAPESYLALEIGTLLKEYLLRNDIGFLYGADTLIEFLPKLVRGPDVCFVPWTQRPDRTIPTEPISDLLPELVVEVLSPSNTTGEIRRKIKEYFKAGVKIVWVIDPPTRSAVVHVGPDKQSTIPESGALLGGNVLPGFKLPLTKLFARLAKPQPKRKKK